MKRWFLFFILLMEIIFFSNAISQGLSSSQLSNATLQRQEEVHRLPGVAASDTANILITAFDIRQPDKNRNQAGDANGPFVAQAPGIEPPQDEKTIGDSPSSNPPAILQGGDNFSTATVISSMPFSSSGTTTGFAHDYDLYCMFTGDAPDVVYAYTPASNGFLSVSLCGSEYDSGLGIFRDDPSFPMDCNNNYCASRSQIDNLPISTGHTYFIVISGYNGRSGNYTINVTGPAIPPSNDLCINAQEINVPYPAQVMGTTIAATADCPGILNGNPVWYAIQLPYGNNDIDIDFLNTPYNLYSSNTAYFADCSCNPSGYFTEEWDYWPPYNRYQPKEHATAIPGPTTIYYAAYPGHNMDFAMNINVRESPVPPSNDDCVNAQAIIAPYPVTIEGTTEAANIDCPSNLNWHGVWYTIQLPYAVNQLTIDFSPTCSLGVGSINSIGTCYTYDCACASFQYFDYSWRYCQNGLRYPILTDTISGPTTIYFPVNVGEPKDFEFTVNVVEEVQQVDYQITAPCTWWGGTCGAGNDCILRDTEDETWAVTIPHDGEWVFSLCNSYPPWDTYLFLGTVPGSADIGQNDNGCPGNLSYIRANLTAGTYYLDVEGYSGCGGYQIDIAVFEPPPDYCINSDINQPPDYENGVLNVRSSEMEAWVVDDIIISDSVTLDSVYWHAFEGNEFVFSGMTDIIILDDSAGVPGAVLYQATGVHTTRLSTGNYYHAYPEAIYGLANLNVPLLPGTYFVGFRPVGSNGGLNYQVTAPVIGSEAYYKNPTLGINDWIPGHQTWWYYYDVSFCLYAHPRVPHYPPNDNCADVNPADYPLIPGTPLIFNGNDVYATRDCESLGWPEVWIPFSTTDTCMDVTISLCGSYPVRTASYDYIFTDCPCGNLIWADDYAYDACTDGNWMVFFYDLPPGNYYYPLISSNPVGPYTLTITGAICSPPPPDICDSQQLIYSNGGLGQIPNYSMSECDPENNIAIGTADDFVLPGAGTITISSVVSFIEIPSLLTPADIDITVTIYNDNNGIPGGRIRMWTSSCVYEHQIEGGVITSQTIPPDSCTFNEWANGIWQVECPLDPVDLTGGTTYWLEINMHLPSGQGSCHWITTDGITGASAQQYRQAWDDSWRALDIDMAFCLKGPTGIIAGTVTDSDRQVPIPNVNIVTHDASENIVGTNISASDGSWILNLPPGTYHEHFSKAGYSDTTMLNIIVTDGNTTNVNTVLTSTGCSYTVGDINGNGTPNGIDVVFGVNYFKGGNLPPVDCHPVCPNQPSPFFAAGDVNGNCQFNGIDVTFFVRYLKGEVSALLFCADCPPAPNAAPAVIQKAVNITNQQ